MTRSNRNAVAIAAALLLGACGGGDADEDRRAQRPQTTGAEDEQGLATGADIDTTSEADVERAAATDEPFVIDSPLSERGDDIPATYRNGDEQPITVRDAILRRERDGDAQLMFFRDDVDCAAVTENPLGDDAFVAMMELQPESADMPPPVGPMPPAQWTYRVEGQTQPERHQGGEGWVTVTRAPTTESFEGLLAVETTVDDELVEMRGGFTAVVCEVTASAMPTGAPPADRIAP